MLSLFFICDAARRKVVLTSRQITVNDPSYEPTNWQGTLFIFAMVAILYVANVWCAKSLPVAQNPLLALHIIMFIVLLIIFAVKSPHVSAKAVFTQLTNEGGWSNMGVSVMVGQITAIYGLFCKYPHDNLIPFQIRIFST